MLISLTKFNSFPALPGGGMKQFFLQCVTVLYANIQQMRSLHQWPGA